MYLVYHFRTFYVILKILFLPPKLVCLLYIPSFVYKRANSGTGWVCPVVCDSSFHIKKIEMPSSFNLKNGYFLNRTFAFDLFHFLDKICFPQYISPYPPSSFFLYILGSSTMQYVILTYMKHLGVKVKEPRNLEQKRGRIGFLPKIKVVVLWPECICLKLLSMGASLEFRFHFCMTRSKLVWFYSLYCSIKRIWDYWAAQQT